MWTCSRLVAAHRHFTAAAVGLAAFSGTCVVIVAEPAMATTVGTYRALDAPQRLVDTRPGESTADGQLAGVGAVPAGTSLRVPVAGRAGLPAGLVAVMLNITVTQPSADGFITAYPCEQPPPTASNVNHSAGQTVANAVAASVGPSGAVCLFSLSNTHLIVDVSGWFETGSFAPLPVPARLLDTRPGRSTVDGQFAGVGPATGGSPFVLRVGGRADLADSPGAVALNVTATGADAPGFVVVYACGGPPPTASNVNFFPGQTVPNLVITKVADDGTVCLFSPTRVHLIVDVSGALPPSTFVALPVPARLLDTRLDQLTADGRFAGAGAQLAGATLQLAAAGRVGIPTDASALVLNVTVVGPDAPGFVTVHPRGTNRPLTSNVNYPPGAVVANTVVARVGRAGEVCLFNLARTDIVVDVAGWLTGPPPPGTGDDCPSLVPTDPFAPLRLLQRPAVGVVVGVDRIAVLACDLPGGTSSIDPAAVAAWANAEVAPWFLEASRGRYQPIFEVHPLVRISRTNQGSCVFDGPYLTEAPFTNVLVVDTSSYGGGQASPGFILNDNVNRTLSMAPSRSGRGAWVGGGSALVSKSVFIHEIGHTIHWPHSGINVDGYDNPIDVMSGSPLDFTTFPPPGYCASPGGFYNWCAAQNTLAFNRMAAGWLDGTQVAIHPGGQANYTLDRPNTDGLQLVAVTNPFAFGKVMAIDARPAIGRDVVLGKGGVTVHLIDQLDGGFDGISTQRRQRQAVGEPESYDHVLAPGEQISLHGVTVRVLAAVGDGYQVAVTGTYAPPESLG